MSAVAFNIGKYAICGGILAPMAGYTDIAFRELCKENGAGLTVTEMISTRGLVHCNAATKTLMRLSSLETPSCIQLFGNEPDDFARAAAMLDCDIIDVNMGCPMPKVVKNGDGAALLKDPERAGKIVTALKNATDKPITVKTRLGYCVGDNRAAELVESVAKSGADAIAVHGRYAEQRYSGAADYAAIAAVVKNVSIPIIVNGDIAECNAVFPFSGVMIGRAALCNPAVFSGKVCNPFSVARRHIEISTKYFDDRYTVLQARKFFVHYFKGICGSKVLRDNVNRAETVRDVLLALDVASNETDKR